MASLSFLQLNIERAKHYDRFVPFVKNFSADVFCAQELLEKDLPFLEKELGMKCIFSPMTTFLGEGDPLVMGVGIFSRYPMVKKREEYYFGTKDHGEFVSNGDLDGMSRVFLYSDIEKDGKIFRIGTTHFTWSKDGEITNRQRRDLARLLPILKEAGEIVFSGDFNTPRGREIFSEITSHYNDNVPPEYTDSIDNELHRNKDVKLMVDGLFSTPKYEVSDVKMVCGLSDHCALTANVSKRS